MNKIKSKKINRVFELMVIALLTLWLFFDFFPQFRLLGWFPIVFWTALILVFILYVGTSWKLKLSQQEQEIFTFYWGIYLFSIIALFSLLGGKSTTGVSLTHPIVWLVLVPGIYMDWRKVRKYK